MDPKQTEGQNPGSAGAQSGFSFQTGQMGAGAASGANAANTGASDAGTLSTGANVSRTMDSLNSAKTTSATSESPFAKHKFDKVTPVTGDILIDNASGSIISSAPNEKKGINRGRLIQFGLVFGGLALVGLVVLTVVLVINNQPKTQQNTSTNTNTRIVMDPEDAFEEWLEELVTGEIGRTSYIADDGDSYSILQALQAVNGSQTTNNILYADRITNQIASDGRAAYLDELASTFEIFSDNYSGENADLLEQISYYYHDFAEIAPVTEADIVEHYLNNGLDDTKKYIEESYGFSEDRGINDYNAYSSSYAMAILNLVNEANTEHDCNITASSSGMCDISSLANYQAYVEAYREYNTVALQIKLNAWKIALDAIKTVYLEYNDVAEEEL